ERHALIGDALREIEQRGDLAAGRGVGEGVKDARVHRARPPRVGPQIGDDALRISDVRGEQQQNQRGDEQLWLAAAHVVQSRMSTPRYGRSAAGTWIVPSGRWCCSSKQAIVRGKASPDPLSVCTKRGFSPLPGR